MKITGCSILITRNWFAENAQGCINEAVLGKVRVNDIVDYIEWREGHILHSLTGMGDNTFAFQQRAWYIQTGECIPLLNF